MIFFSKGISSENKIHSFPNLTEILLFNLKGKTTCNLTECFYFYLSMWLKIMNWQNNREVSNYLVLVLSYCSALWFTASGEKSLLVYMQCLNSGEKTLTKTFVRFSFCSLLKAVYQDSNEKCPHLVAKTLNFRWSLQASEGKQTLGDTVFHVMEWKSIHFSDNKHS